MRVCCRLATHVPAARRLDPAPHRSWEGDTRAAHSPRAGGGSEPRFARALNRRAEGDDRNAVNCDQQAPNTGKPGRRLLDGCPRDAPG